MASAGPQAAARTFPGDTSRQLDVGCEHAPTGGGAAAFRHEAKQLDEQMERLRARRDAELAQSPFHPVNRGQSVGDRMRMRNAGVRLSGEYNALAMAALETDPELAFSLLQRGLTAAPKGDVSLVKTLCNLGVCCLHTGRAMPALRYLRQAVALEGPHVQGGTLDRAFRARVRLNLCAALNHSREYNAALAHAEAAVALLSPSPPPAPRASHRASPRQIAAPLAPRAAEGPVEPGVRGGGTGGLGGA